MKERDKSGKGVIRVECCLFMNFVYVEHFHEGNYGLQCYKLVSCTSFLMNEIFMRFIRCIKDY